MTKTIVQAPSFRKLQGYAFDPSLSLVIDTVDLNNMVYKVDWEEGLLSGPVGEYVEVVDYDPTTQKLYQPVDLNNRYLLARDGLSPSEGNPQFHQQMVYAVAMTTIKNFEKALGRKILWAPKREEGNQYESYVQRLRIYPHALREANAYYSPAKKSVLCGYFTASPADKAILMPGSLVFTCLSHDIIAHEVTHAILDGLHRNYSQPSNPDVLAFHEAFADIVALFQHFTFPEVLKHQIAETKGDLEKQNLLGKLAQQFGSAIGMYGSLRDALGEVDKDTKVWKPRPANTTDYQTEMEPHKRGSILVAAVFDAFLKIYKERVSDLIRIASGGTGKLPEGDIHPDLVNRMTQEAAKSAGHILRMCIRAIDYCPPVDINFGDFLRAIITADIDITSEDSRNYRLAFIDAFRRRGIYPEDIVTLSEESLRHAVKLDDDTQASFKTIADDLLRPYLTEIMFEKDRKTIFEKSREVIVGKLKEDLPGASSGEFSPGLHRHFQENMDKAAVYEKVVGLVLNPDEDQFGAKQTPEKYPSFQILNLRLVSRVGPDDQQVNQVIFSMVQTIGVVLKADGQIEHYTPKTGQPAPSGGFEVQGGCTLIFDLDSLDLKHAIRKPILLFKDSGTKKRSLNTARILKQNRYETEELPLHLSELSQYFESGFKSGLNEPFALLHHH